MNLRHALLVTVPLMVAGCHVNIDHDSGPAQRESINVEKDKAEMVRTELHIGAGELNLRSGASKLMEGDFSFAPAAWKPVVNYTNTGVRGLLKIEQPSLSSVGNHKSNWDVRLNNDVAMDLALKFGAGEGHLNIGDLLLRSLEIEMGVGEIDVDLRGKPRRGYDVNIRGGVGEATVRLPRDVGIYAEAKGGIGGVSVHGLKQEGGHWVNDAWDKAGTKIRLDVKGGIGAINVYAE